MLYSSLLLIPLIAQYVTAWGFAGHSIVATIAEIHLHPQVLSYLQLPQHRLLPTYAKGHLAPVASWPDRIRMVPEYRGWSGQLHYASWIGDHPPETCSWPSSQLEGHGEEGEGEGGGWKNDEKDVLHAIANYTMRLERNPQDWESLRFLIHFIGDAHQPMHLTNRERGGNGDPVRWEGRRANLHGLWDNLLLARKLRETKNYTEPLPSRFDNSDANQVLTKPDLSNCATTTYRKQIESALTGAIYDPLIRLLLWEGVRSWWRSSIPEWLACPSSSSSSSSLSLATDDNIETDSTISLPSSQITFSTPSTTTTSMTTNEIVCPIQWATGTHRVTCELAFPVDYDEFENPPREVGGNTKYYRDIADSLTIEKLLTQAGLRLAATLNTIFSQVANDHYHLSLENDDDGQEAVKEDIGVLNFDWMKEDQH